MVDALFHRPFTVTLGLVTILAAPIFAGNPWDSEPTLIPEEAYEVPEILGRNPKHRFGAHGGVLFGVKAKFLTKAFTGTNITVDPAVGPEIEVNVDRVRGSDKEEGALGADLFYELVLGESDFASEGVNETWGLHFGIGYNELRFRDKSVVDGFDGGGNFLGSGLISQEMEADLWRADIGLFKESHLTDRFYAKVGGGLTLAYMDAEVRTSGPFNFEDDLNDEQEFLFGGYLDLTLGYDITRSWGLYAGLRYQYLTSFDMDTGLTEAEVKFNQSYMAFLGMRFAF